MDIVVRGELKHLIDSRGSYVLIDVREKEELQHGMIPTAHHLPLHEFEEAFSLSEETFEKRYHFPKPKKEERVIFYCRTGGRSALATAFASEKGYMHAGNYAGSVYDWAEIDPQVQKY